MSTQDISVIIVSYNTANLTSECIASVSTSLKESHLKYEIIVVDNNSTDNTLKMIEDMQSKNMHLKLIKNETNKGFGAANNIGIKRATGDYVLLLNSDVVITSVDWQELIDYLRKNPSIGVLTVDVILKNGKRDMACHRGFPTIWRSFTYFTKLESLFGHIPFLARIFGGYHLLDRNFKTIHEIDSPTGAFYLTRKDILKTVKGFDEDYFMYGEDLDLSYKIKQNGYRVIFYPYYSVMHFKNQSGIKKGDTNIEKKTKAYFYDSMQIFYDKHYSHLHSVIINKIIHYVIRLKKY